jgi:hypothetical protein
MEYKKFCGMEYQTSFQTNAKAKWSGCGYWAHTEK